MISINDCSRTIVSADRTVSVLAQRRLDNLTKPVRSLGVLEAMVCRIAAITGSEKLSVGRKFIVVMAADHGVTAEGVSAYPSEVTYQMVHNFLCGGAAINVLARQAGAQVVVVDMGVQKDLSSVREHLVHKKIASGTANMALGAAMSRVQAVASVEAGINLVYELNEKGVDLIGTGEMGIGNTTAAAAITSVFLSVDSAEVTGRGAGIDDATFFHKIKVIRKAIEINRPAVEDPLDVLSKVGGFEIGGMAGIILGAASLRIPVVLDGYISGAAALLAARICPAAADYMIASHCSVERGHKRILDYLELRPVLNMDLRLGEGTGAALAMNMVEAAVRIYNEMATFEGAGVSNKTEKVEATAYLNN